MLEVVEMIGPGQETVGKELVLDIHQCNSDKFSRESLEEFLITLCDEIKMQRKELFVWEYQSDPDKTDEEMEHLAGFSMVLFLVTSNITLHSWENSRKISLNIFSCKDYPVESTEEFCANWFSGEIRNSQCFFRY